MEQRMETWTIIAFAVCLVIGFSPSPAGATATISGPGPFTITQDTQLVGDVDCSTLSAGACITFAAPNLQLNLNGFTIKGPTSCIGPVAGIYTNFQDQAKITGPGKVENFSDGVAVNGSKSQVRTIVAIRNCSIGIRVDANQAEISDNIVLNNNSPVRPGITINGNNNNVQANEVHGNGNGIAVQPGGTGNQIKLNSVTTNTGAGIELFAGSSNNTVDLNLVLNNTSVDIDDGGVANAVTGNIVTQNNVCERGRGAAAQAVCADSPTRPFLIFHVVGQVPIPGGDHR